MKRRLALILEYQGSRYQGFQVQPRGLTVQGELERALEGLVGEHVRTEGASRTDSGAHAWGQVVALTTEAPYPTEVFIQALNASLPRDIRVREAYEVGADFDPRRHATGREYHYRVLNQEKPSALWREFAHHVPHPLDVKAMQRAAASRVEEQYQEGPVPAPLPDTERPRVIRVEVREQGELVTLVMKAQAFSLHQVRRTAGALVEVGRGRLQVEEFQCRLWDGAVPHIWPLLPACGLFLMRVSYPDFPPGCLMKGAQESWLPPR